MELLLGSNSPRRKEILSYFSLPFTQANPDFDEDSFPFEGDPKSYALQIASGKALSLAPRFPEKTILTADTVVYREGKIYLKPADEKEACKMLKELSGNEHQVYTAVALWKKNELIYDVECSRVFFQKLTDPQIDRYQKNFKTLDKAGGYAIQKGGSLIVKRIEGCYYNIMGLPIQTVQRLLLKVGIDLWDHLKRE